MAEGRKGRSLHCILTSNRCEERSFARLVLMLLSTTRVGGFHPQFELTTSDRPMIVLALFPLHCRPRGVGDDRDEDRYYTGQSPKRLLQSHQISVPLLLLLRATKPPHQSVFVPASCENLLRTSLGASPSFASLEQLSVESAWIPSLPPPQRLGQLAAGALDRPRPASAAASP